MLQNLTTVASFIIHSRVMIGGPVTAITRPYEGQFEVFSFSRSRDGLED